MWGQGANPRGGWRRGVARQECCNVSVGWCLRAKHDCGCGIDWQVNAASHTKGKSVWDYMFFLSLLLHQKLWGRLHPQCPGFHWRCRIISLQTIIYRWGKNFRNLRNRLHYTGIYFLILFFNTMYDMNNSQKHCCSKSYACLLPSVGGRKYYSTSFSRDPKMAAHTFF